MKTVPDRYDHIVGVDTHARTHTYAILSTATGEAIDQQTFPASPTGNKLAVAWLIRCAPGLILAAVECTST